MAKPTTWFLFHESSMFLVRISFSSWISSDFVLTSGQTVVIACSPSEELVVRTALEMLGRDIQTVLSSTTQTNEKTGEIVIGTVGQNELISRTGVDVSALRGKKQAFLLSVSPEGKLIDSRQ